MLEGGTILTSAQYSNLFSAVNLVQVMGRAIEGIEHEGNTRKLEMELAGLFDLSRIVGEKLEFVACTDDLEAELSRRPYVSQPETLSELIVQLLKVHQASGDMPVYAGDMKHLSEFEVVTAPEEPEKHGRYFLHLG